MRVIPSVMLVLFASVPVAAQQADAPPAPPPAPPSAAAAPAPAVPAPLASDAPASPWAERLPELQREEALELQPVDAPAATLERGSFWWYVGVVVVAGVILAVVL